MDLIARIPHAKHDALKQRLGTALIGYTFPDDTAEIYGPATYFFDDAEMGAFDDGAPVKIWKGSVADINAIAARVTREYDGILIMIVEAATLD